MKRNCPGEHQVAGTLGAFLLCRHVPHEVVSGLIVLLAGDAGWHG